MTPLCPSFPMGVFLKSILAVSQVAQFPGGSVVKNLPAKAGDTGSIPDPGRS